jgi:hypothetical protein
MISHIDLVTRVQRRADVDDDTARAAISAATGAVARQMMNEARDGSRRRCLTPPATRPPRSATWSPRTDTR